MKISLNYVQEVISIFLFQLIPEKSQNQLFYIIIGLKYKVKRILILYDILPMIKLKINHTEIEVPSGTTIHKAAEKLGFEIPTMCHNDEVEHFTSCMICL
ncbi:MAG: (2Fe-2S)-binding protein, partial [Bacteroidales bacterium]|nr:(2Fe-2S)-binding protein [Bacteroidales bacterium]